MMMRRGLLVIIEAVTCIVPATKCEINPTHKCKALVDDDNLLVMCPEEDSSLDVVWMAEHLAGRERGTAREGKEDGSKEDWE